MKIQCFSVPPYPSISNNWIPNLNGLGWKCAKLYNKKKMILSNSRLLYVSYWSLAIASLKMVFIPDWFSLEALSNIHPILGVFAEYILWHQKTHLQKIHRNLQKKGYRICVGKSLYKQRALRKRNFVVMGFVMKVLYNGKIILLSWNVLLMPFVLYQNFLMCHWHVFLRYFLAIQFCTLLYKTMTWKCHQMEESYREGCNIQC